MVGRTCAKVRAVEFVDIPAAEDTASRPCPFGPSPACSLGICVVEVKCTSGQVDKARPLAAGWLSRDCWPCCTAGSAS